MRILSLPENLNCRMFAEAMLNKQFLMYHEISSSATYLLTESEDSLQILSNSMTGLTFQEAKPEPNLNGKSLTCLELFNLNKDFEFSEVYKMLNGLCDFFFVSFVPVSWSGIFQAKRKAEAEMSKKEIRMTQSARNGCSSSCSTQSDLYYGSDKEAGFA